MAGFEHREQNNRDGRVLVGCLLRAVNTLLTRILRAAMVLRNSIYNLLGLGLPLIVAVIAIPELVRGLGVEQFGILMIIWAVVSYFGLFDLGLGRAVTQQVATAIALKDEARLKSVVGTSSALMFALGIFGGAVMFASAPIIAKGLTQSSDPTTVTRAFYWMALAMPAIVLTSGYRGILEAMGRFGVINAIRFPMGVFTYAGPLVVVWLGYGRLDTIAAVLCVGRIITCGIHGLCAMRSMPSEIGAGNIDRAMIRPLLSMGGWISVSNVVSPLMNYIDRFLLGFVVSAAAVAYYATPQELVLRMGIIPTAVAAVLFPLFTSNAVDRFADDINEHVRKYSIAILSILMPFTLVLIFFAHPLLEIWISTEFANQAEVPLQIMSVAALFSGLAQIPFTMIQARERADLTAKLHIAELPVYLILLYVLVVAYGVNGAALAWLIRIAADMVILYYLCARTVRTSRRDVFQL